MVKILKLKFRQDICGEKIFCVGKKLVKLSTLATLVTHSLTHSCLVNLIDVTLACEDSHSKLFDVVTVADVADEDRVGNSIVQISKLRFGQKAKFLFRL